MLHTQLTTRILQGFQALLQAQGLTARQDSLGHRVPAGIWGRALNFPVSVWTTEDGVPGNQPPLRSLVFSSCRVCLLLLLSTASQMSNSRNLEASERSSSLERWRKPVFLRSGND